MSWKTSINRLLCRTICRTVSWSETRKIYSCLSNFTIRFCKKISGASYPKHTTLKISKMNSFKGSKHPITSMKARYGLLNQPNSAIAGKVSLLATASKPLQIFLHLKKLVNTKHLSCSTTSRILSSTIEENLTLELTCFSQQTMEFWKDIGMNRDTSEHPVKYLNSAVSIMHLRT